MSYLWYSLTVTAGVFLCNTTHAGSTLSGALHVKPDIAKNDTISALALSRDGRYLALGTCSGRVQILDVRNGLESKISLEGAEVLFGHLPPVKGCGSGVTSLAFEDDSSAVIAGGVGSVVAQWDVSSGQHRHTVNGPPESALRVNSLGPATILSPKGPTVASLGQAGELLLWDGESGLPIRRLRVLRHPFGDDFYAFSKLSLSEDSTIYKWNDTLRRWEPSSDVGTLLWLSTYRTQLLLVFLLLALCAAIVRKIKAHRRAQLLRTIVMFEFGAVLCLAVFVCLLCLPGTWQGGNWRSVAFSDDGQRVAGSMTIASDSIITLWDVKTGDGIAMIVVPGRDVSDVALSPDGRLIGCGDHLGAVVVYDIQAGEMLTEIMGAHDNPSDFSEYANPSIAFVNASTVAIAGVGERLILCDVHRGLRSDVRTSPQGTTASIVAVSNGTQGVVAMTDGSTISVVSGLSL